MTHKSFLYDYLDTIWPEAPAGPVEGNDLSQLVYDTLRRYSPNPDNPPFYVDLPLAFPSGELIQEVWDRWLSFDPVVNWRDRLDNLRKLKRHPAGRGVQRRRQPSLGPPFAEPPLTKAGIAHEPPGEPRQPRRPRPRAVPGRARVALKNARTRMNARPTLATSNSGGEPADCGRSGIRPAPTAATPGGPGSPGRLGRDRFCSRGNLARMRPETPPRLRLAHAAAASPPARARANSARAWDLIVSSNSIRRL